jgi:EAL domain-containing protein (putative c-di-GMP-specific phosphodiesterase class I)
MLRKPEEQRIVKAMLSLGRALGLKTTAEGVETEEALEHLQKLGCDTGQGYLFGKPQPAAAAEAMIGEEANGTAKLRKEGTRSRRIA